MAKGKDFTKSLGSKNLNTLIPTDDNPAITPRVEKETSKRGRPKSAAPATTVTTFRINNDNLLAVKAIAFWDRKKIQDVFNEALQSYIDAVPASSFKKAMEEYKKRNNIS